MCIYKQIGFHWLPVGYGSSKHYKQASCAVLPYTRMQMLLASPTLATQPPTSCAFLHAACAWLRLSATSGVGSVTSAPPSCGSGCTH
jgi:hypothetical protein